MLSKISQTGGSRQDKNKYILKQVFFSSQFGNHFYLTSKKDLKKHKIQPVYYRKKRIVLKKFGWSTGDH